MIHSLSSTWSLCWVYFQQTSYKVQEIQIICSQSFQVTLLFNKKNYLCFKEDLFGTNIWTLPVFPLFLPITSELSVYAWLSPSSTAFMLISSYVKSKIYFLIKKLFFCEEIVCKSSALCHVLRERSNNSNNLWQYLDKLYYPLFTLASKPCTVSFWNNTFPVQSSANMQPRLHISTL